jgi:hypothetical protein
VEESSETDSSDDKTSQEIQNAGRLFKCGLCIGLYLKMNIQSAERQKLEDTVLSVLART